jgi:hypothetical protein
MTMRAGVEALNLSLDFAASAVFQDFLAATGPRLS